jgi:hypothetical protein
MACELEADDALPTAIYSPVRAVTLPALTAAGPDRASVSPPAKFLEITDAPSINDPWDSRDSTTVDLRMITADVLSVIDVEKQSPG